MYINTRNITIIMTRIVANLLRLCAVCLRLLLYLWHSNDPEPKVHFFPAEVEPAGVEAALEKQEMYSTRPFSPTHCSQI